MAFLWFLFPTTRLIHLFLVSFPSLCVLPSQSLLTDNLETRLFLGQQIQGELETVPLQLSELSWQ